LSLHTVSLCVWISFFIRTPVILYYGSTLLTSSLHPRQPHFNPTTTWLIRGACSLGGRRKWDQKKKTSWQTFQ
jgi:hypothetical protein